MSNSNPSERDRRPNDFTDVGSPDRTPEPPSSYFADFLEFCNDRGLNLDNMYREYVIEMGEKRSDQTSRDDREM